VAGAKKLRLVLLDACRVEPLTEQMRPITAGQDIGGGFKSIESKRATLVVYATKNGEAAEDGVGEHWARQFPR
jgi:hypothetical protein